MSILRYQTHINVVMYVVPHVMSSLEIAKLNIVSE